MIAALSAAAEIFMRKAMASARFRLKGESSGPESSSPWLSAAHELIFRPFPQYVRAIVDSIWFFQDGIT